MSAAGVPSCGGALAPIWNLAPIRYCRIVSQAIEKQQLRFSEKWSGMSDSN
jgi:hypothetical protein